MMRSQLHNESTSNMTDFSSVLLHTNTRSHSKPGAGGKSYEDELKDMFDKSEGFKQGALDNRNISSVLNSIKDDGPAISRRAELTDAFTGKRSGTSDLSGVNSEISQNQGVSHATDNVELAMHDELNPAIQSSRSRSITKNVLRVLSVLILLTAIAMLGVIQYRTDVRLAEVGEQLENNSLDVGTKFMALQQAATTGSKNDYTVKLNDKVAALENKLSVLQVELMRFKSERAVSDNNIASVVMLQIQPQLNELQSAIKVADGIKLSLSAVKNDISFIKASSKQKIVQSEIIERLTPPIHEITTANTIDEGWVVNLASLSDRHKARIAYEKLRTEGVSPLIQEVELKGKKIYRLSVDGFSSRSSAEKFVKNAVKKYGFSSGWIRRG